jgi:hypothetical protein
MTESIQKEKLEDQGRQLKPIKTFNVLLFM